MAEIHRIGPDEPTITFPDALLRIRSVVAMVGLSKSEIQRRIATERFPRPVVLGEKRVAWRQSDLQQWIASLPLQTPPKVKRLPPGGLKKRRLG